MATYIKIYEPKKFIPVLITIISKNNVHFGHKSF